MPPALDFPASCRAAHDPSTRRGLTSAQPPPPRLPFALALAFALSACGSRTGFELGPPAPEAALGDAGAAAPTVPLSVLLFGGVGLSSDGSTPEENDTWIWTAKSGWTERHPPRSPSPRSGAAAASTGTEAIVFGGDAQTAETWAWDGTTWTQRHPGYSPPPITSSLLVPLGGDLVLFSGYSSGIFYHDTWRWDGTTWANTTPTLHPAARDSPAGDVLGGSLVIFGGEDVDFLPLADTWTYDGTSWTLLHPAHSPSARRGATAATFRSQVVLFGGDILSPASQDWLSVDETWVWDGTDWSQKQPAHSPSARSSAGMATAGDEVVLFGGGSFQGTLGNPDAATWTWDGHDWSKHTGPGPGARNYPTMVAVTE